MISIITPVRTDMRREAMLIAAYESVLGQSYGNWEWLVVVDGPDYYASTLKTLLNDDRVKVLSTGRIVGAAAARNMGLLNASGRFITALDDDDLLPPGSLSSRAGAMVEGLDWVCGHLADLHDEEVSEPWSHPLRPGIYYPGQAAQFWKHPEDVFLVPPTGILARKEPLLKLGGWGGTIQGEDLMLYASLVNQHRGKVIPDTVYYYRKHVGQTMQQYGFDRHESDCRALAWHRMIAGA